MQHDFFDNIAKVEFNNIEDDKLVLKMKPTPWLCFDRGDVIAMAKAFKLTSEEVK